MAKKKILLVYTGGTIGSDVDSSKVATKQPIYVVQPSPFALLRKAKGPESKLRHLLEEVDFDIITPMLLMSEDIVPADWEDMARVISRRIGRGVIDGERLHGVIITHGTDTLSYTATALAFLLRGVPIPVVLTGASYPPADPKSDALRNLRGALLTVLQDDANPGVFVSFKEEKNKTCHIHLGSRVQQIRPFETSFTSIHDAIYAEFTDDDFTRADWVGKLGRVESDYKEMGSPGSLDRNVFSVRVYPGMRPCFLKFCAEQGARAIVLETYHSATFCNRRDSIYDLLPVLRDLRKSGVRLLFSHLANGTAQVGGPEYLSPTIMLEELGAIPLRSITTEAMLIKTMWAMSLQPTDDDAFSKLMTQDQVNEICERKTQH